MVISLHIPDTKRILGRAYYFCMLGRVLVIVHACRLLWSKDVNSTAHINRGALVQYSLRKEWHHYLNDTVALMIAIAMRQETKLTEEGHYSLVNKGLGGQYSPENSVRETLFTSRNNVRGDIILRGRRSTL